jgi:DNA-binding transcriptional MerR regulator
MSKGEPRWTIAELGERVLAALADTAYEPPRNGQVRAVPDLRTIRYYTTLGLLDRPAAMRGRTALYGPRHLLQLVAVKRLQADGKSLSEVQAELAGLDDEGLAAVARVDVAVASAGGSAAEPGEPAAREARFWAAAPAPARVASARPARARASLKAVAKIELAPGVSLIVEPAGGPGHMARAIDPHELARAAAPLLEALRRHGLACEAHEEEETE